MFIQSGETLKGRTNMRLENKVALISGGARGMGAVEAKLFAQEGAKVVIGDVLDEDGKRTEAEINETGGDCVFVHLDVTDAAQWRNAVNEAVSRFGKLDILVNNAGIYRTNTVLDTSASEWDQVMDINAKGVFVGTKAALPELKKTGAGSIVNISSVAGLVGNKMSSAYTASKGAVRLFTKSTAIQYAADGIRANSVHPGTIETPMTAALLATPEYRQDRMERTPIGRLGKPEDVAYGVLYLASDEASFVTGAELVIDGGRTAE